MIGQRKRSGRFAYVLVLLAAITVQALIGLQVWQHWGARERVVAEKQRELGNIVQIVQHDMQRTIEQVDAMLRKIAAQPGAASRFQPPIHDHAADHQSVSALFVVDEAGRLLYSSAPELIDVAEFSSRPGFAQSSRQRRCVASYRPADARADRRQLADFDQPTHRA